MRLVRTHDQIAANIETLEAVRREHQSGDFAEYAGLIKRGTCFLPYHAPDGIAFAPSRFIGYVGNNFAKHSANENRDERLTNGAINQILEKGSKRDTALEEEYLRFCMRIDVSPSRTGTFGVARKYWVVPEITEQLDRLAEIDLLADHSLTSTEKEQLVKARVGQGAFRDALMVHWHRRCSVTGCTIEQVLRASHIKPWRVSSNAERLDPFNGLLLTANIDILFDRGLISFNDDGTLTHARAIRERTLRELGCDPTVRLKLDRRHAPYLEYHRSEIFAES